MKVITLFATSFDQGLWERTGTLESNSLATTVQSCPRRQASLVQRLVSICTTKKQRYKIQLNKIYCSLMLRWFLCYGLNKLEMCYNIFIDSLHFDIEDL